MKRKIIRKMLNDYTIIKLEIEDLNIEIEELKSNDIIKGCGFDEKFSTNEVNSQVESYVINKVGNEKIEKLEMEIKIKEFKLKKIDNALKMLSEEEIKLVKERYFKLYKSWRDVSVAMQFEIPTCKKKDAAIIDKLSRIIC